MVWGALIGAGASLAGNLFSRKGQKDANKINVEEAQKNRDFQAAQAGINRDFTAEQAQNMMNFQEHMSSTAHQRQVKDLRSAGLNPMLAMGGQGASSAQGAMGAGSPTGGAQAQVQNVNQQAPLAVNSAIDAYRTDAQVALQNEQAAKVNEETMKVAQEVRNLKAAQGLTEAQTERIAHEISLIRQQAKTQTYEQNLKYSQMGLTDRKSYYQLMENNEKEILAEFYSDANFAKIAKEMGVTPNTVKSIMTMFFRGK